LAVFFFARACARAGKSHFQLDILDNWTWGGELIEHINHRLNQWARWRLGGRGSSKSPYPAYNLKGDRDPEDAPPDPNRYVPVNDLECADTDKCVCALNPVLQKATIEFYCRTATTVEQKARYCGCSGKTLYRRVDEAHRQIMGWLNDLSCGIPVHAWTEPEVKKQLGIDVVTRNTYISAIVV
jgi:hypothetical protein